jgi:MinD-like ATPase involved in chromosome partitioning or flagellar assembly
MPLNRICSWCGDPLSEDPSLYPNEHITSHGICDQCSFYFDGIKSRISEFIVSFDTPLLIVDSDVRAISANLSTLEVFSKSLQEIEGKFGGEIIECVHSHSPEKCGRTDHCSGCAMRTAITHTAETGIPHEHVKSFHIVMKPDNTTKKMTLIFSTEKIDSYVLMTIEKLE